MNLENYIDPIKCKTFASKTSKVQVLINHTLFILDSFGVPMENTPRRLERMAIAFLAVADIRKKEDIRKAKNLIDHSYALKTRQIIEYVNEHFQEKISSGSYDDIRRRDLSLLVAANIVLKSSPNSATNDSTRGYGLNPEFAKMLLSYGAKDWSDKIKEELEGVKTLAQKFRRERKLNKIPVELPSGKNLEFSVGLHNDLQKAIIEEFLPIYGYGAKVLYVGDSSDKYLHLDEAGLKELNFFEISHDELPDVIAYSKEKNWLYLIEAVYSTGAISELRLLQLSTLTEGCSADIVYVTAFLDRNAFRKSVSDIAWETEVWIAENPEHLIHFNGDKFLGPYKTS